MSIRSSRIQALRTRLELPTIRRASGLLDGRHRSLFLGSGHDFAELVEYSPGDSVSDIDWKSSARAGIPIIKRYVTETNLNVGLIVDSGANMAAQSAHNEAKHRLTHLAASVFCLLAHDRGDRVSLVAGDAERDVYIPPRAGTEHIETLLRKLDGLYSVGAPANDYQHVLQRAGTVFRRRSLLVLLTDEARPGPEHEEEIKKLRTRHEIMAITASDLQPLAEASQGLRLDIEHPVHYPPFLRHNPRIVEAAARAQQHRGQQSAEILARHNIAQLTAHTEDQVLRDIVSFLAQQKVKAHAG